MDLARHVLELLRPLECGGTIAPGVRWVDVATDFGLRLICDASGRDLYLEIEPAADGRAYAARTPRLLISYRGATKADVVDPAFGLELCRTIARVVEQNEQRVLAELERERELAKVEDGFGAKLREVTVSRLLEPTGTPGERWLSLSPYVGCLIGCRFCYAQSRIGISRELAGLPQVPWGSYVDVRINAAEVLAAELAALPPLPVKFCPIVSDPYQAVEKRYRLTRACLRVLSRASQPRAVMLLSRSAMIAEDAELIGSLALAYAGASIPTVDEEARRHFEPRGSPIPERLKALKILRAAGARPFAIVQPLLPGDIGELADVLAEHVESARIDVLYGVEGAAAEFSDARFSRARDDAWQRARARELAAALEARGVEVWPGELPRALRQSSA